MKRGLATALIVIVGLAAPALASTVRAGSEDRPLPDTSARQSKRGFSGHLLVTADRDWRAKWDAPGENAPVLAEAREVQRGGELSMLILFSNPRLDAERKADVRCDIQVERPDGSLSADQKNLVCYQGPALGDSEHVYLAAPVVRFLAEPTDQAGVWTVRVTLRDEARRTVLPLESAFTLVDS